MKKTAILLITLVLLLITSSLALAGSPITYKVTGGGHFISDAGTNIGDLVYLSMVGMEKDEVVKGGGSYRDPDIGLEANLNFNKTYILSDHYVCFDGNADVYTYGVFTENKPLRVCATDEYPYDGIADRIGVVIGSHYTHIGYGTDDYAGHIMIH